MTMKIVLEFYVFIKSYLILKSKKYGRQIYVHITGFFMPSYILSFTAASYGPSA